MSRSAVASRSIVRSVSEGGSDWRLPLQLGAAVGRRGLGLRQRLGVLQQVDQAQVAEQRVEQAVHVLPALGQRVDAAQELARLALRDEVDEVDEGLLGHEAEQAHGILDGDRAVAGGRELVEDRERVAVGAGAGARDRCRTASGASIPSASHTRESTFTSSPGPGPPEREALAARADRAQELGGIGRAEHEDDVRRRLLERLQERVRGVRRERVRLVQDVDLVAALGRLLRDAFANLADVVDAAVRGGVHLDHVERGRIVDAQADRARAVGLRGRAALAVERLREDLGERRLARAARPREQVGMRDAALIDRGSERAHDVILTHHVRERARAVGAIQRGHGGSL